MNEATNRKLHENVTPKKVRNLNVNEKQEF